MTPRFKRRALPSVPTALAHSLVAVLLCLAAGHTAQAQTVQPLNLDNVPPDMVDDGLATGGKSAPTPVDLGEEPATGPGRATGLGTSRSGIAVQAARAARLGRATSRVSASSVARPGTERVVFARQPVRVTLPVGRERLITLPAAAALRVPTDIESVARLEVIDRTLYATALVPFVSIRIVAELLDTGELIPMDIVASAATASATAELEIFSDATAMAGSSATAGNPSSGANALAPGAAGTADSEPIAADMVQLTRFAARALYAPSRLGYTVPGIRQVAVDTQAVNGLLRGVLAQTVPLGQWRSGNLYVTAVRVSNQSQRALEIPLENLRGRWISATAQHGRIGPKGTDTDTTAVYLVCDRSFEACL